MSPKAMKGLAGLLCVTVLALLTFGFVMLASTSSSAAYHGDPFPTCLKRTFQLSTFHPPQCCYGGSAPAFQLFPRRPWSVSRLCWRFVGALWEL
jgi:hypothetical protein